MRTDTVLVVNCGSSSVKFALFAEHGELERRAAGELERIGDAMGQVSFAGADGATLVEDARALPDHAAALDVLLELLERHAQGARVAAVGHRVVHGGEDAEGALPVDEALLERLRSLVPLAPLHLPHNVTGIAALRRAVPGLPQFACFDTAFHRHLPPLARLTGLPREFQRPGLRRFGFHGLSYEYVMDELRRRHGAAIETERMVLAHLGNGASMAAVRGGRCVETTMGFSTLAGLPMGTRSGDIDPGLLLYLLTEKSMSPAELRTLLYEGCGLAGLSGIGRDMRDLIARAAEPAAREAIEYYCYHARRHLGALAAVLGGLDRLVFTGGIGTNAPEIRARICDGFEHLGLTLDPARNASGARDLSAAGSPVCVEAFATDEERMIALHVRTRLAAARSG